MNKIPLPEHMKEAVAQALDKYNLSGDMYLVGGAVRDLLRGRTPHDYDYVIVGGNDDDMYENGFFHAGRTIAIFMHKETKDEVTYARNLDSLGSIAHTNATLETDLRLRDFSLNSVACDKEHLYFLEDYGTCVNMSDRTFSDDTIRMFRYVRMMCEYECKQDEETHELFKSFTHPANLKKERLQKEVFKLFALDHDKLTQALNMFKENEPFFKEFLGADSLDFEFSSDNLSHDMRMAEYAYHTGSTLLLSKRVLKRLVTELKLLDTETALEVAECLNRLKFRHQPLTDEFFLWATPEQVSKLVNHLDRYAADFKYKEDMRTFLLKMKNMFPQ